MRVLIPGQRVKCVRVVGDSYRVLGLVGTVITEAVVQFPNKNNLGWTKHLGKTAYDNCWSIRPSACELVDFRDESPMFVSEGDSFL